MKSAVAMPLTSFFNNHKQQQQQQQQPPPVRSPSALPAAANNVSSSSLPSPNPHLHLQHQLQHQLQLQQTQHHQQHEYTAYSPPPTDPALAIHHQQQQLAAAAQKLHQNPGSGPGPVRHSSISSASSAGPHYGSSSTPATSFVAGGLIRQSSSAAESQQTLRGDRDNNTTTTTTTTTTDYIPYSSTSSIPSTNTVYSSDLGQQQQQQQQRPGQTVITASSSNTSLGSDGPAAAIPTKSTLRKPVLLKEPSSSGGGGGISGLFHRHSRHSDQAADGSSSTGSSIGRKLSTRKSQPPTPQQSPNIPQQIDEDSYTQGARSPRPQSLLPPSREHADALRVLKRSDTDSSAYSHHQRPSSLAQAPPAQQQQQQPYYNVATGQYASTPSPVQQQQSISPSQSQQRQPQSTRTHPPPPPPLPSPSPSIPAQVPPQQQYPGLKPVPLPQQQSPITYSRNSSDLSALQILTNHTAGNSTGEGLSPGIPNNNPPVSPGASTHTVETMPGNNPTAPSGQSQPQPQPSTAADGRATPTGKVEGNGGGSGMTPSQVQALMTEFDTLQAKYRKVKNLYFDRAAEIERLQNTMANQRMSQSRTALDDNQYASRFERLDGAIKNLAFEIRQSWKVIPGWLQPVVNPGAEVKGGREMTVVGRAAISRWVVDEILDRFFHPCLEPATSANLKHIENAIRRNSPQPQSAEEDDNLSSKVCQWRMATMDGVRVVVESTQGKDYCQKLKEFLEEKLTASLAMHLNEPLPSGLEGGVKTIIDIGVGLLENLPMESRDVRVWYPLPGEKFDSVFMRGETGLQPLLNPGAVDGMDGGTATGPFKAPIMVDGKPIGQVDKTGATPPPPPKDDPGLQSSNSVKGGADSGKKQSVLKGIRGKLSGSAGGSGGPPPPAHPQQAPPAAPLQPTPSQTSLTENVAKADSGAGGLEKVRVAGFMAVEVRGKSILIKAPVWT